MRVTAAPERERARRRAAAALACAGLGAALAYVVQRLYDYAISGPVDPLLVLRESHVAYYWRTMVATWWGGVLGAAAYGALGEPARVERAERVLRAAVIPIVVVLAIATARWP